MGSRIVGFFLKLFAALVVLALLVVVGANGCVILSAFPHVSDVETASQDKNSADCIVVPGASVMPDGSLSPILQRRVDAAIELYNAGVAKTIVMSGNGTEEFYNEPDRMKEYAVEQGVPEEAIVCDEAGLHTFDTMWRVKNVYGASKVLVVTQRYHLSRAVFDGWGVGLKAYGVVSDEGEYDDQLWYEVREAGARVLDFKSVILRDTAENVVEPIGDVNVYDPSGADADAEAADEEATEESADEAADEEASEEEPADEEASDEESSDESEEGEE